MRKRGMTIMINRLARGLEVGLVFLAARLSLWGKRPAEDGPPRLLIVKLDAIGDYVLFRNFLAEIKKSAKYHNHQITFCGHCSVKSLAEYLDGEYVDEFIWIDKNTILHNPAHLFTLIKSLYGRFLVAIQPTYSREYIGDLLIKFSDASRRCGCRGDNHNISIEDEVVTNGWYTDLLEVGSETDFEFYKNKKFFIQFLANQLSVEKPSISPNQLISIQVQGLPDQPYAVLFPGAQEAIRRWPTAKFAALGDYLADKYGLQIVIDGSANDSSLAQEIITKSTHQNFIDFTGQTALPQLARVLSSARLVISNDTSAAHIAFAVGTDVLVIAQFSYHYHRFIPYPAEISGRRMLCLWPAEYRNLNTTELRVRSGRWSVADTDLISVAEARLAADKLMS